MMGQHKVAALYGSISMFTAILHNIFLLYHIDMFVSIFKIDKTSFWIGETIFLVWNSVNDPLIGWLNDHGQLSGATHDQARKHNEPNSAQNSDGQKYHSQHCGCEDCDPHVKRRFKPEPVREDNSHLLYLYENRTGADQEDSLGASPIVVINRTKAISVCGPLLAASFLLILYDWHYPLIQFTLCLCLYDTFLTVIDLQHSALLAELSVATKTRTLLNTYQSAFSAFGAMSVFLSYTFWDKSDLTTFRHYCMISATVSATGFYMASSYLRKDLSQHAKNSRKITPYNTHRLCQKTSIAGHSSPTFFMYLKQVWNHKNFQIFSAINLIQVFHCHFNSNFFPLFLEALVDAHMHGASFIIGISFVLPHVNNMFFLILSKRYGVYTVIRGLFLAKLVIALIMWHYGLSHRWLVYLFIACNRIFTEGTCRLMSLVVSDLVDEDYVINDRREPISALMFGTANFLSKPGQALAPILGTSLISAVAGFDIFSRSDGKDIESFKIEEMRTEEASIYRNACFTVLVSVPIFCAIVQLLLWSLYKLHGARLSKIRYSRANLHSFMTV